MYEQGPPDAMAGGHSRPRSPPLYSRRGREVPGHYRDSRSPSSVVTSTSASSSSTWISPRLVARPSGGDRPEHVRQVLAAELRRRLEPVEARINLDVALLPRHGGPATRLRQQRVPAKSMLSRGDYSNLRCHMMSAAKSTPRREPSVSPVARPSREALLAHCGRKGVEVLPMKRRGTHRTSRILARSSQAFTSAFSLLSVRRASQRFSVFVWPVAPF